MSEISLSLDEALARAALAQRYGRLAEAESLYTAILRHSPDHSGAEGGFGALTAAYREVGRYTKSAALLRRRIVRDPRDAQAWAEISYALLLDQKEPVATAAFIRAKRLAPDHPDVLRGEARLLLRRNAAGPALQVASAARDRDPRNLQGWLLVALAQGVSGRVAEALALLRQAIVVRPDFAEAYANHGNFASHTQNRRVAFTDTLRALKLKPHLASLRDLLPTLAVDVKDGPNPIALAVSGAVEAPERSERWSGLSSVALRAQQVAAAEKASLRALAISPNSATSLNDLGLIAQAKENWSGALDLFEQALALCPDRADILVSKAVSLREMDRLDDAAGTIEMAIPAGGAFAYFVRGVVRERHGLFSQAEEDFRQTIALGLENADISMNFGLLLLNSARIEEAWGVLSRGICHSPVLTTQLITAGMIAAWLGQRWQEVESLLELFARTAGPTSRRPVERGILGYHPFLKGLSEQRSANGVFYTQPGAAQLTVFGDSHSLTPSAGGFDWIGGPVQASTRFVFGAKMFHIGTAQIPNYREYLFSHLRQAPDSSHLLFIMGEIDCRPKEGLWKARHKKEGALAELVAHTVDAYLERVSSGLAGRSFPSVTIQGVPAPGYPLSGAFDPGDREGFLAMIVDVNRALREGAGRRGWHFLDIHAATADARGMGNGLWHLPGDEVHLKPAFYSQAAQWIVSP